MVNYKTSVCKSIVSFYQKKLFLLEQIRKEIPNCKAKEAQVFNDLSGKLQKEGIQTQQWINVYKKVQQFNKDIKYQYSQINNSIAKIRAAQSWPELNAESNAVLGLLNRTNGVCNRYFSDLYRFSQETPKNIEMQDLSSVKPVQVGPQIIPHTQISQPQSQQNIPIKSILKTPSVMIQQTSEPQQVRFSEPQSQNVPSRSVQVQLPPPGSKTSLIDNYSSAKPNTLSLPKGTEITIEKYAPPDWALVRTNDNRLGYIGIGAISK